MMFTTIWGHAFRRGLNDVLCTDNRNKDAFLGIVPQISLGVSLDSQPKGALFQALLKMNFFSITLSFGSFEFATVKVIDTVWNLIVSRIGQILFGIVTYKVIIAWLVEKMKSESVPYQLLRETALSKGFSLMMIWHLLRSSRASQFRKKHWGQLFAFAFCVFLVLVYPTLSGAMAGYKAQSEPYFQTKDGNLSQDIPEGIPVIAMSLDNGHLLGLSDPTYVWSNNSGIGLAQPGNPTNLTAIQNGTQFMAEISRYSVSQNCTQSCSTFHWPNGKNTTWSNDERLKIREFTSLAVTDPFYIEDGDFVTGYEVIHDHLICVSKNVYAWGFSWHMLKIESGVRRSYGVHRAMIDLTSMAENILGQGMYSMADGEIEDSLDRARAELMTLEDDERAMALASSVVESGRVYQGTNMYPVMYVPTHYNGLGLSTQDWSSSHHVPTSTMQSDPRSVRETKQGEAAITGFPVYVGESVLNTPSQFLAANLQGQIVNRPNNVDKSGGVRTCSSTLLANVSNIHATLETMPRHFAPGESLKESKALVMELFHTLSRQDCESSSDELSSVNGRPIQSRYSSTPLTDGSGTDTSPKSGTTTSSSCFERNLKHSLPRTDGSPQEGDEDEPSRKEPGRTRTHAVQRQWHLFRVANRCLAPCNNRKSARVQVPKDERKPENVSKRHKSETCEPRCIGTTCSGIPSDGMAHHRRTENCPTWQSLPNETRWSFIWSLINPEENPPDPDFYTGVGYAHNTTRRPCKQQSRAREAAKERNAQLEEKQKKKIDNLENIIETLLERLEENNVKVPNSLQKRLQDECPGVFCEPVVQLKSRRSQVPPTPSSMLKDGTGDARQSQLSQPTTAILQPPLFLSAGPRNGYSQPFDIALESDFGGDLFTNFDYTEEVLVDSSQQLPGGVA
ncbi:hypothetical protein F25303_14069 [Fusarium sp. NRRL 25303]|nr:hypothetical protein F25303_14069 [Fusarium sp. NRRL 25303]